LELPIINDLISKENPRIYVHLPFLISILAFLTYLYCCGKITSKQSNNMADIAIMKRNIIKDSKKIDKNKFTTTE
jgi:hypothetical protein